MAQGRKGQVGAEYWPNDSKCIFIDKWQPCDRRGALTVCEIEQPWK